jgi:hypothetical protein
VPEKHVRNRRRDFLLDTRWVCDVPFANRACKESDNVQKNGGFGLEHAFRETNRGAANYHLLMQLAHTLWQLPKMARPGARQTLANRPARL